MNVTVEVNTSINSRPKVILHFGAHKTGTSLIQKYMRDRASELSKRRIGFIQRSDLDDFIGWGSRFANNPDTLRQKLEEIAEAGCKHIAVSHENSLGKPFVNGSSSLYGQALPRINAYVGALRDFDLTFIYYLRCQWEFVESYYIQKVHQGSSESFEDWYKSIRGHNFLSWRPLVEVMRNSAASSGVIKDFASILENGQEWYIGDFFAVFVELNDIPSVNYKTKRNISVGESGLAMLRAANAFAVNCSERKLLRKFFQANFNNLKYPRPSLLKPEQMDRIKAMYSNEMVDFLGTT